MDADFWHRRWETNCIGFHQAEPNRLLRRHFSKLRLPEESRVFLPLCGKTLDIGWLLDRGYRVAGIELNESAISQLFQGLGTEPEITRNGPLAVYRHHNIDVFAGDIFKLSATQLGPVDAIYDRAALVALPAAMRHRYTDHLAAVTGIAPQLLLSLVYDQARMQGPPFSVSDEEIRDHYQAQYRLRRLSREPVSGGLKGLSQIEETAWLLNPRAAE